MNGNSEGFSQNRIMKHSFPSCLLAICLFLHVTASSYAAGSQALGYTPKYPQGFNHFDYVNPVAPRGGRLILSAFGSFDSLNPFLLKGISAAGLAELMFESLMESSLDEPFTQYGLLAEDVSLAKDGLSVIYRLNPAARFHDGTPVTAEDVKFSFENLKDKAVYPQYRFSWTDIKQAVVIDRLTIRFDFARVNPELHMIVGQIPVFSRHWVEDKSFDKVVMDTPLTSGPYQIEKYELGKYISFVRNPDYWGKNLGVRRGMYNFDRVTYKYYRDFTVILEAFKAGEVEFINEYNSKKWARDYVGPAFEQGEIIKTHIKHSNNAGMQGFVFNTRRELFKDKNVRRAISLAMDFEWSNHKLFYDQYDRCDSYFSNSELASRGLPSGDELALLKQFKSQLDDKIFTTEWRPASTKPPGGLRANLRQAKKLLTDAGWTFRDGALRNKKGVPFQFEIMLAQKGFERILAPFARNLAKLGIQLNYRTIDVALYQQRADSFDFDMMVTSFGQSQSPGNELMYMFHSSSAEQKGSRNSIGIKEPVIDALVEKVIYAKNRDELVTATRALDRVLLHGEYLVPNWYIGTHRIAYWDRFKFPETLPLYYQAEPWLLKTAWKK